MPEATKSEGFGGSHKTFMVVPQVYEMKILVPGPPTGITTDGADLDFTPPNYDGGGRICGYEVSILVVKSRHSIIAIARFMSCPSPVALGAALLS